MTVKFVSWRVVNKKEAAGLASSEICNSRCFPRFHYARFVTGSGIPMQIRLVSLLRPGVNLGAKIRINSSFTDGQGHG